MSGRFRKFRTSKRALLWGVFIVPYAAIVILAAVSAAFLPAQTASAQGDDAMLCRFRSGCMSEAMCDKAEGRLVECGTSNDAERSQDPNSANYELCPRPGWGMCYPPQTPIGLVIPILGKSTVIDIGEYIDLAYKWAVGAAAVVSAAMLMLGGIQYLTGGDSERIGAAKKRIQDALIGLGLVAGAWLILNTINPQLLNLQSPRIPLVPPRRFILCEQFKISERCGKPFALAENPGVAPGAPIRDQYRIVEVDSPEALAVCTGSSCTLAGQWDATHSCKQTGTGETPDPIPETGAIEPWSCEPCQRFGTSCQGIGPSSDCCSGFCGSPNSSIRQLAGNFAALAGVTGVCTNGNNGVACSVDEECFSGHCADLFDTLAGGACVSGKAGAPCDDDDDCNTGLACVEKIGIHVCVVPQPYGPCAEDSDCPAGAGCDMSKFRCNPDFTGCTSDASCRVGPGGTFGEDYKCWTQPDTNHCKMFWPGSVCLTGGQRECDSDRYGRGFCCDQCLSDRTVFGASAGICAVAAAGVSCDENSDCTATLGASAFCSQPGQGGGPRVCAGGAQEGEPCAARSATQHGCVAGLVCPEEAYKCVRPRGSVAP